MKKVFVLVLFGFFSSICAQKVPISSFYAISSNYKFNPKWFLYTELQSRGNADYYYPDYYEIKGGLGYAINNNNKSLLGLGRYASYSKKIISREEFRIWLQHIYDFKLKRFRFENRFRSEYSWFYEPQKNLEYTRIRLRYRLNVIYPINHPKIQADTWSVNAFDEVFFVPTDTEPLFARNRVYGGLGYQVDEHIGFLGGYLWQREFAFSGTKNVHYLYLCLNLNL